MMRLEAIAMIMALAVAGVAGGVAGEPDRPADGRLEVGVVVEETAGASAVTRHWARAEVSDLRRRGARVELRLARSPSQALAAAVTLATRGADRLVLVRADPVVLDLLRRRLAHVEIDAHGAALNPRR